MERTVTFIAEDKKREHQELKNEALEEQLQDSEKKAFENRRPPHENIPEE